MDREELLQRLDGLAHFETDAISIYAEGLNCANERNPEIAPDLERCLADHQKHLEVIGATMRGLGGTTPEAIFDPVGRFLHWPTMLRANPCRAGAFEALAAAEHYHHYTYDAAMRWDTGDAELAAMLREFAADEARHRAFVEEQAGVAV